MGIYFTIVLSFFTFILLLNTIIKDYFDKLTMFNGVELHWMPSKFITLYMFFGFIMLLFYKKVREYRKVIYMENHIKHIDYWKKALPSLGKDETEKYIMYKRYLKLKQIKNKSNKIF